jgi:hypothetical protein
MVQGLEPRALHLALPPAPRAGRHLPAGHLPHHAQLPRRRPRLHRRPAPHQPRQLIIGGTRAPPPRTRHLLGRRGQRRRRRARIPGAALREPRQPRITHRRARTTGTTGQRTVATGLRALVAIVGRRVGHGDAPRSIRGYLRVLYRILLLLKIVSITDLLALAIHLSVPQNRHSRFIHDPARSCAPQRAHFPGMGLPMPLANGRPPTPDDRPLRRDHQGCCRGFQWNP